MSSSTTSGANTGAEAQRLAAVAAVLHLVAAELEQHRRSPRRRRGCRRRRRMRQPRARPAARRRALHRRRGSSPTSLRHGSATRNSEPAPGAGAASPRPCRRAARPGGAPASGRRRGRPALRSSERLPCSNSSNMCGSSSASMPMPLSRTLMHAPGPGAASARRSIAPPSSVYLAALLSRLATTCDEPREVAAQPRPARRAAAACSWWRRAVDERPRASRCACATTARRSSGSRLQRDLALADARDVEQVLDQARQLRDLAVGDVGGPGQLRLGRREPADHLERGADRRERVAQLVREHRQELVLAPVRLLQQRLAPRRSSISICRVR